MSLSSDDGLVETGEQHSEAISKSNRPLMVGVILGGFSVLILPVIVLVWRIDMCNYGLGTDYSGVCICLPVFISVGAAFGALAGLIGQGLGHLIAKFTSIRRADTIGLVAGSILAVVLALLVSVVPAFMFAFPDC